MPMAHTEQARLARIAIGDAKAAARLRANGWTVHPPADGSADRACGATTVNGVCDRPLGHTGDCADRARTSASDSADRS